MISVALGLALLSNAVTMFCAVRRSTLSSQTSRRIVLGAAVLSLCSIVLSIDEPYVGLIASLPPALMWIYFCKPAANSR